MTAKAQLFTVGAFIVAMGGLVIVLGLRGAGGSRVLLITLGALTLVLGLVVGGATFVRFSRRRRLPEHLRRQAGPRTPHTLTLRDGRKIRAIAVFPGGFLVRRRTDPAFDAREVVDVVRSTAEDIEIEEARRQKGSRS